jgi:hypothetical protein
MKKITFFVALFCFSFSFSQVNINENFDSGTPAGWTDDFSNTTDAACSGSSERVNAYSSNAENNLTSPNLVAASNATDLTVSFDYQILDYPAGWQDPVEDPTPAGWGSAELQYSTDDGTTWTTALTIDDANHVVAASCATMMATIPAASLPNGSDVKLRIIQTWVTGDYYFYVDNFSATQVALSPPNCDASLTVTADVGVEGDISWSAATGVPSGYNLTVGSSSGASDILATTDVGDVTTYNLGTLSYTTTYYATIESYNVNGVATGCTEQTFVTEDAPPAGTDCNNPLTVAALPYNTTDNTANYGDDYNGSVGATGCGTTNNYLNGDDVVYAYTATSDTSIKVALSSIGSTYSGVFVYTDCADIGTACVAGFGNASSTANYDFDVDVTNGTTYYIVISTWATPQSTTFTLNITENTCTNPTVDFTVVSDCDNSGGFMIEADITDLGSATSLTVSDDQGSTNQSASATGVVSFGPYANGTDVTLTITNEQDLTCFVSSDALTQSACPPANDTCANAIAITPGNVFTDNPITGQSNVGATDSGEMPLPDCASYDPADTSGNGGDLWYSVTIPSDGNLTIETDADPTGSSGDGGMAVYTGTCGSLTLFECDDDDGNGAFGQIIIDPTDGLADQTVYIRVWEYSGNSVINFQVAAFSATLSTENFNQEVAFSYYPNPVNNTLTLSAQKEISNVAVFNMLGQEVIRTAPNAVSNDVDMSNLQSGVYFVQVTIGQAVETVRVIKN